MFRQALWGIDNGPYLPDYLAAFQALGFETRLLSRPEAEFALREGKAPDLLLDVNAHGQTAQLAAGRGVPYVAIVLEQWYASPRQSRPQRRDFPDGKAYVFTLATEQMPIFKQIGYPHVEYMPFGIDTDRFKPLALSRWERERFGSRVSFVGTSLLDNPIDGYRQLCQKLARSAAGATQGVETEACDRMRRLLDEAVETQCRDLFRWRMPELLLSLEAKHKVVFLDEGLTPPKETWAILLGVHVAMRARVEVVRRLAPLGLAVWGSADWPRAGIAGLDFRGPADRFRELPQLINAACVNVNVSKPMFDTAVCPRVFEVLACGGFLLTNRTTALSTLFVDGRDLVVYESLEDLEEKARYYLAHPEERLEIGERGCRKVRALHSGLARARRILEVLKEDGVLTPTPESCRRGASSRSGPQAQEAPCP